MKTELQEALLVLRDARTAPPWVAAALGEIPHLAPALLDAGEVAAAVAPYAWLVARVGPTGLALTAAGYLRPTDVQAAMDELGWSTWWIGEGNREHLTYPVTMLRESAMRLKLVRRLKGRLVLAPAGRAALADPSTLWSHVAASLPVDRDEVDRAAAAARLLWAAHSGGVAAPDGGEQVVRSLDSAFTKLDGHPLDRSDLAHLGAETDTVLQVLGGINRTLDARLVRALAVTALRGDTADGPTGRQAVDAPPAGAASRPRRPRGGSEADVACLTLKVTLLHVTPPVWRRVRVPKSMKLSDLAGVLVAAMGWAGYHLWSFHAGQSSFGIPDPDWPGPERDARRATVGVLLPGEGAQARFDYDFGDGWEHRLVVESIAPGPRDPVLLAGRRHCPPEDVGGPWGYQEFLEAIGDPGHPEHEQYLQWSGGSFDPAAFDLDLANQAVRAARLGGAPGEW